MFEYQGVGAGGGEGGQSSRDTLMSVMQNLSFSNYTGDQKKKKKKKEKKKIKEKSKALIVLK